MNHAWPTILSRTRAKIALGDDAKYYQERDLKRAIENLKP